MMEPLVVVLRMLPEEIPEMAKEVVVACMEVTLPRVDEPVRRRLERVARPVLSILNSVVVAD